MAGARVRAGGRREWSTRDELLAGGAQVVALAYQRASRDRKKTEKSVGDQERLNGREIASRGWSPYSGAAFTDNDLSSSRHARKDRPDFERLMETIRAGVGDVLVMWELARGQRDLAVYVAIRDLCVEVGLRFWLVGGVLYDLNDKNDRMSLGFQAVQAEFQADYIRDGVLRGMAGAAEDGRPHGKIPYGYRRVYDPKTGAFVSQELDFEPRTAVVPPAWTPGPAQRARIAREESGGASVSPVEPGGVVTYSPAEVVREIFGKLSAGVSLTSIGRSLNARGIPSPTGKDWTSPTLSKIAVNPTYIGKRVFQKEVVGDGQWPPMVTEDTYWSCVRIMRDPSRRMSRSGRAVHLASYIANCGVCGGKLSIHRMRDGRGAAPRERVFYRCRERGCVAVEQKLFDEFIERTVVRWLSRRDVFESFASGVGDEQIAHARAQAQELRVELEDWRAAAERREVDRISFGRISTKLLADIEAAENRATEIGIPPVLKGRIGEEAAARWAELGDDGVEVKREIIRAVADLTLNRVGDDGVRASLADPKRLVWRWKFGTAAV